MSIVFWDHHKVLLHRTPHTLFVCYSCWQLQSFTSSQPPSSKPHDPSRLVSVNNLSDWWKRMTTNQRWGKRWKACIPQTGDTRLLEMVGETISCIRCQANDVNVHATGTMKIIHENYQAKWWNGWEGLYEWSMLKPKTGYSFTSLLWGFIAVSRKDQSKA